MPFPAGADAELKHLRTGTASRAGSVGTPYWLGISNNLPPDRIPPSAFADAQNILPGLADKFRGNVAHLTSPATGAVQGMFSFVKQSTANHQLLYAKGGKLLRDDEVELKTGLSGTAKFEFAWFLDYAYHVNGVDGLMWWNGTTWGKIHPSAGVGALVPYVPSPDDNELNDAASAIQTSKFITVYKNHVCLAGAPSLPYRVYFSDLVQADTDGGATYFKGSAALDFQSPRGGKITGFVTTNSALFVLKDDSIFVVTGNALASFVVNVISTEMGCPSGRTARFVPGLGVVFQGSDGHFYRIVGVDGSTTIYNLKRLSKHFSGEYGANGVGLLNFAKLEENNAGIYGDYYWCAVCTGANTTPDKAFVMNHRRLGADPDGDPSAEWVPWSVRTHPTATCWVVHNNGSNEYFMAGDTTSGQVWRIEEGSYADDGAAISAYADTAKLHFGRPENRKTLQFIHLTFRGVATSGATISTTVYVDDKAGVALSSLNITGNPTLWDVALWDVDVWDLRAVNKTKRLAVNKTGQLFQFRFANAQAGVGLQMFEVGYNFTLGLAV